IIIVLRQLALRISPFRFRTRFIKRLLELSDLLLGFRQRCCLLVDNILEWFRIDTEKDVSVLEWSVRLDRHFGDAPPHSRKYRSHRVVDASVGCEWVIVAHAQ